jgi:hypothetical protein
MPDPLPPSSESKNVKISKEDQALLKTIRERYDQYARFWKENYDEGDEDMRCLSTLGPWPEKERLARKDALRPCEHYDVVSQYNRRIVNQSRMNPRGIKINPTGESATEDSSEKRENRIRAIEHDENANHARLWALQCAVDRGIGFYEVCTEFVRPGSFNQKITVKRIPNPRSVLMDPHCKEMDRSDAECVFKVRRESKTQFPKKYPNAQIKSFEGDYRLIAPQWIDDNSIQIASYWERKMEKRQLVQVDIGQGPTDMFLDELPGAKLKGDVLIFQGQQVPVLKQRLSDVPVVYWYETNGVEILDREKLLSTTIPVLMVTGMEKYEGAKLIIESVTRKARSGQLAYDVAATGEMEALAQIPKSPYWMYEGQDEGQETILKTLHSVPRAYATVKAKTDATGEEILPLPQRIAYDSKAEVYEMAKASNLQIIQNAIGMQSVERKDRVAKSNVALETLNRDADVSSFHFQDNLDRIILREYRIINELLEKIEDFEADRGMRTSDGEYRAERITPMMDPQSGEVVNHPYGKAEDHEPALEIGPNYQDQVDKAADFLDELVKNPQFAPLVMDLVILMKGLGPMGRKAADRVKTLLPDAIQQQELQQAGVKLPPAVTMKITQLQAQLQEAQQLIVAAEKELKEKNDQKAMELDSKERIAAVNAAVKLSVAELGAQQKMMADQLSAFMQQMEHAVEALMQGREIEAERGMAGDQRLHEAAMSQREHYNAMEQAEQGHDQTLEQTAQQAALTPQPEAGA